MISKIEWTDYTWNPWRGCTKVSPGCAHCYAETLWQDRHHRVRWGRGQPRERAAANYLQLPFRWNKQAANAGIGVMQSVFFGSLMDFLDPEVPQEWLDQAFHVITQCDHLRFLCLTKRPEHFFRAEQALARTGFTWEDLRHRFWLGVSVEDQAAANKRFFWLSQIRQKHPSIHAFLSCEPLIGPVSLYGAMRANLWMPSAPVFFDWVIIGGESGPQARPCHLDWVINTAEDASNKCVPVFIKQMGANPVRRETGIHPPHDQSWPLKSPKGGDPDEWPKYLRVRQFPWS